MKLAPHAVDVSEGQHARVGSVCQQDVNAFSRGINPTTSAGKTCMAKSVRRQSGSGRRIFGGCELPGERACFVQTGRQVPAKQVAGLHLQQL